MEQLSHAPAPDRLPSSGGRATASSSARPIGPVARFAHRYFEDRQNKGAAFATAAAIEAASREHVVRSKKRSRLIIPISRVKKPPRRAVDDLY